MTHYGWTLLEPQSKLKEVEPLSSGFLNGLGFKTMVVINKIQINPIYA